MNKEEYFKGIANIDISLKERNKFSILFLQEYYLDKELIESIINDDSFEFYHPSLLMGIIFMTEQNHNLDKLRYIFNIIKHNYK